MAADTTEETDEDNAPTRPIFIWLAGLGFSGTFANLWTEFAPRWSDSFWADLSIRGATIFIMMFAYGKTLEIFFPLPDNASEAEINDIRGWPRVICLGVSCIVFSVLFLERPLGHFMRDHYGPPQEECWRNKCDPDPIDTIIEFD